MNYPQPTGHDWRDWARQFLNSLMQQTANRQPTDPRPVQLAHLLPNDKATTDGILMWDPVAGVLKVSKAGAWVNV